MTKEFNFLSMWERNGTYSGLMIQEAFKEFIKILKEDFKHGEHYGRYTIKEICKKIDKLSGGL